MDKQKLDLVMLKVNSIRRALKDAANDRKAVHVSVQMAENFNGLLAATAELVPHLQSELPAKIMTATGPFIRMGSTTLTYLELEAYLNQLTDILDYAQKQ
jgi:hypothetical protein